MSLLKNNKVWFLLLPVVFVLLVWGPYWIWNLAMHQVHWWRVLIISGTVFDTPAYLQWIGQTSNGWDVGGHLRWFVWPLRALIWLVPQASVSEWWLISRWISMILVLWSGGWAVGIWSGMGRGQSRLLALLFWISFVLALGLRPGVFSWYLPFGIFALTVPILVTRFLNERRVILALGLTVIALAASFVYSWFFIVATIWLTSIWGIWIAERSRKLFLAGISFAILLAAIITPFGARWLSFSESGQLLMDLQIKVGLGFTHVPQITNSFLAMLIWVVLALLMMQASKNNKMTIWLDRFFVAAWAWVVLLCAWLITLFTGVYLHSDHFRVPVVFFSWMSLALILSALQESPIALSRRAKQLTWILFGVSLLFILNILRKPYTFDNDDLSILHFSHWFTAAMSCVFLLTQEKPVWGRWNKIILVIGTVFIGGAGALSIYIREFKELPHRMNVLPAISWIREQIPIQDNICSDPGQADLLATYSGRRIFPAGTTLYYHEPSSDVLRRTQTYVSAYDVIGSGNAEYLTYLNYMGRSMICQQFPKQASLLRAIGFSEQSVDWIVGCPRAFLREIDLYSQKTFRQSEVEEPAFSRLCPWVVISQEQRAFWRLPSHYIEFPINETISAWHTTSSQYLSP